MAKLLQHFESGDRQILEQCICNIFWLAVVVRTSCAASNMCVLEDVRCLCGRRERDRQRAIMCVKLACPLPCLLALALRWQPSLWPLICHTVLSSSTALLEDVDHGPIMNRQHPQPSADTRVCSTSKPSIGQQWKHFGVKLIFIYIYFFLSNSEYSPSFLFSFLTAIHAPGGLRKSQFGTNTIL